MLFRGNVALSHPLLKDGINEKTVRGTPKIIGGLLTRFLDAAAREFGHQDGHWVGGTHFERSLLSLCFTVLIMQPSLDLLKKN